MASIEAICSIIKKAGQVIGFSLVAEPQNKAECFCRSMPTHLIQKTGSIEFKNGKITFIHPQEGEVSFVIDNTDASILQELLSHSDDDLGLYNDGLLTPGFKIVMSGMENEGEKIKLERI